MSNPSLKRLFGQDGHTTERLFYKIGEVSRIAGVEPSVLRYWEKEFSFLKPRKTASGQRIYSRKDLEMVLLIKKLLYEDRYTIEGVKKRFGQTSLSMARVSPDTTDILERIKNKLKDILNSL